MQRFTKCKECNGRGRTVGPWYTRRICFACSGTGSIECIPVPPRTGSGVNYSRAHTTMRASFVEPGQSAALTVARGDELERLITDCIVQDFENDPRCERILRDLEARIRMRLDCGGIQSRRASFKAATLSCEGGQIVVRGTL